MSTKTKSKPTPKVKLKEAPTQVTIEVTQEDIDKGIEASPESCAIARAVKRTMGDHPSVHSTEIDVTINKKLYNYDLPKKAQTFIEKFDDYKVVKPFSFIAKLDALMYED